MRRLALPFAVALATAAGCQGGTVGSMAGSGGGPSSTGGSSASGGNSGTGGSDTTPPISLDCQGPAQGAPVLRLMTSGELQNTLNDVFPEVKGQWSMSLPANGVSGYGFDNDSGAAVSGQYASGLLDTATSVATAVVNGPLATLLPCSTGSANRACAETFLNKYGRRLFRRTLKSAEHDQYLSFFDSALAKSDFKTALKWMTVGLIQSPNAVYRSEIGTVQGGARKLTAVELATELAYTYTGTTPTDDLISKAEGGTLGDPGQLAKTLAATPAGKETLQKFFASYFDYGTVTSVQRPNIANFSSLSQDMLQETRSFVDDVVFQKNGGLKEVLTAKTTNPSKALASYYGFPAPSADYASVTRPDGRGIGILSQGAFLAAHASADASSPTKRGLFPYSRLFCRPKLTPPNGVPNISPPAPGQQTTRQRYESQHAAQGTCRSCHQFFDPLGFGFEHFNEGGQYREKESGLAIDASGTYTPPGAAAFSFQSQEDLANALAAVPEVYQCSAFYLATFAYGSGTSCLGSSSVADLQEGKIGFVDAFVNLASEPHFTTRDPQ